MVRWKKKGTEEEVNLNPKKNVEVVKQPQKEIERKEAVVNELPSVPTRHAKGSDGEVYELITRDEALLEILDGVRELLERTEE